MLALLGYREELLSKSAFSIQNGDWSGVLFDGSGDSWAVADLLRNSRSCGAVTCL
jgi:hypothetical protein